MVGQADLVYFFVSDMDRAVAFYRDVLELELIRRSGEEWSQLAAGVRPGGAARCRRGTGPSRRHARVHRRGPGRHEGEARRARRGGRTRGRRRRPRATLRGVRRSRRQRARAVRVRRSTRERAARRGDRRRHDEVRPSRAGDRQGAVVAGRERRAAVVRALARRHRHRVQRLARPTRSTACTARATTWPTGAARSASRTSARTSAAAPACSRRSRAGTRSPPAWPTSRSWSARRRCRPASRTRRARSSRSSTTSSNARSARTCCGSSRSR